MDPSLLLSTSHTIPLSDDYRPRSVILELASTRAQSPTPTTTTETITMPGKHVHFNEENIFYSPTPSESTPSPTLSESSLPSSSGPTTPPQLREHFMHLGPVAIHPILAYHPYVFPINYNVSYPPVTASANILLTLQNDLLPWRCEIRASTSPYVTVEDVLVQLYRFLRIPGTREEFKAAPSQRIRDTISETYHNRCLRASSAEDYEEEKRKGLKRVDFLMGRTTFMGLSSTKLGPDAWVLNLQ
ncbi:hypothetical protein EDD22DRAFT_928916 [Suillus occidentalis]|nr:hypothetical protein EDD22DRAFT_928916 [Suillus occidentalis]